MLNLASLKATQITYIKHNNHPNLPNVFNFQKYIINAGATPKLIISVSESSSFPTLEVPLINLAILPSSASKIAANNIKVTAAASDMSFIGASIGAAEGEALLTGIQHAIDNKQPFINFTSGGGMRMYENLISLSQMTRITLAINELKKNNLPYIVVMCDATTGGITASYAMLGDINIAEPAARAGFAGPNIIEQTIRQKLPAGFQRSEFLLENGHIDMIVARQDLRDRVASIISKFLNLPEPVNA